MLVLRRAGGVGARAGGCRLSSARAATDTLRRETRRILAARADKDHSRAISILCAMPSRGLEPDIIAYNATLAACADAADHVSALALLDQMRHLAVRPDLRSYTAAINACARGNQHDRAFELFSEMRAAGCEPDMFAYTAALNGCAKAGAHERALKLLNDMHRSGVKPDQISYNKVINACAKGGHWESALALLDDMRVECAYPDVYSYTHAILACVPSRKREVALELFEQVESLPSLTPDAALYNALLDVLTGDRQLARGIWLRGLRQCYAPERCYGDEPILDVRGLSHGAVDAALSWWLEERLPSKVRGRRRMHRLHIVTGWGRHRKAHQQGDLKGTVRRLVQRQGFVIDDAPESEYKGRVVVLWPAGSSSSTE